MMKQQVYAPLQIHLPLSALTGLQRVISHQGWPQKLPIRKCHWWSSYIQQACLQTYRFLLLLHHRSRQSNLVVEYGERWAAGDIKNPVPTPSRGRKAGYCLSADRLSFPPWEANVDCYARWCWMYGTLHPPSLDIRPAEVSYFGFYVECSHFQRTNVF